jgi:hypothetical protein
MVFAVHINRNASQEVVLWSNELMVLSVLNYSVANIQINTERHESDDRNKMENPIKRNGAKKSLRRLYGGDKRSFF